MKRADKKVRIISESRRKPGFVEAVIHVPYTARDGKRKTYSQTVHGPKDVILSKGEEE